ncbi:MAG: hypothetical protein NVS3B18_09120 [Candidatus Dormibacteria bacterium]
MTDQNEATQNPDELSAAEIEAQGGEELPDRDAMSLVNANVAEPVNLAAALNVLSDHSTATATATQTAPITQTS